MEPTQSSETSAYNVRTPGKYPEDNFSLQYTTCWNWICFLMKVLQKEHVLCLNYS